VSVFWRRSLFLYCLLLSTITITVYVLPGRWNGGELLLPLDDVYIHFQYAKQAALGMPYVYNPGLPPSSGATSLLYPYLLAIGYVMGFKGLSLGWWALGLGWLALVMSLLALMHLVRVDGGRPTDALAVATVFALTGPVGWHYASGMETGLLIAAMLWTFVGLLERRFWLSILAAMLMAVIRPEGAIMASVASGGMVLAYWQAHRWRVWPALLPIAVLGIQPLVNWVFTGTPQAAGSSAKSVLSMVPADLGVMLPLITGNFRRMWWEFLTGYSLREGLYLPVGLALLAAWGWYMLMRRDRRIWPGLIILGWLLAGTAAVSTLDPAFWHFKRYQMPFMILLFPLAAFTLNRLTPRWRIPLYSVFFVSATLSSIVFFIPAYGLNTGYLRQQQIPMARWLADNTPDDAVIAVHDVGIMRYIGERTTVDMVGLTTTGASDSWRNGPGALAEFLTTYEPRSDYVASYTDALGLSYLADTGLYGELLAEFPVEPSDRFNVALAGAYQGVWRVDSSHVDAANSIGFGVYENHIKNGQLVDQIDVGNLTSEQAHNYTWGNLQRLPGFPTEVYDMTYPDGRQVLDGGRLINGEESFIVATSADEDAVLVTRVHPRNPGRFEVYANDTLIAARSIPQIPGQWIDIATRIPGELVTEQTPIRIVPDVPDGHYMPYFHWVYQGDLPAIHVEVENPVAVYDGFLLNDLTIAVEVDRVIVDLEWVKQDTIAGGDYRLFLHLYNDLNQPPVAQVDRYPINGALPPGNWLLGRLNDTIELNIQGLEPGEYTLALGLYDPYTGERLNPNTEGQLDAGRLLLETIRVQ
jgi:hypothetical protein